MALPPPSPACRPGAPRSPRARRLAAAILLSLLLAACTAGPPTGPASPEMPPGAAATRPPAGAHPPAPAAGPPFAVGAWQPDDGLGPPDTPAGPTPPDPSPHPRVTPMPAAVARPAWPPDPPPGAATPFAARVGLVWATGGAGASLDRPTALALDRHGELYVVDAGRARLAVFDRDGRFRRAWGGPGGDTGQFSFVSTRHCPGGYHPEACTPRAGGGVAVDDQDRVYVADFGNHRVQVFDAGGRFLAAWGREGGRPGEFRLPGGIAVDGRGRVFVSDGENHRVQVFDREGRFLAAWGGPGPDDGQFVRPDAVALDGQGRLAVADLGGDRVQVFDRDGRFLAAWRLPGGRPVGGGHSTVGLGLDGNGDLVVAGAEGGVEQRDGAGRVLRAWRADWRGEGALTRPAGVAVDAAGDVYVADAGGGRVVKFRLLTPVTR